MANFDELKQKAIDTVEIIADKTVEIYKIAEEKTKLFAKVTKLSADIALEKGDLRKHYRELGKMYYDLHKHAPEEAFAQLCDEVTASLDTIAAKQKEIDALKGWVDVDPLSNDTENTFGGFEESAPGHTDDSFRTVQDTDTLEEPEGDAGLSQTPPTFRL